MAFSRSGASSALARLQNPLVRSSGAVSRVFPGDVSALGASAGHHGGKSCEDLKNDIYAHASANAEIAKAINACEKVGCDFMNALSWALDANQAGHEDAINEACHHQCSFTSAESCQSIGFTWG